jgi:hypothetical protein
MLGDHETAAEPEAIRVPLPCRRMTESIVIERRFRGPVGSGNGGYTCGLVGGLLDADTVEVTLRLPPPLDTALLVERSDGGLRVLDGDALVAEARPAELSLEPPEPVTFDEAVAIAAARPDDPEHRFPGCFVCGPAREEGDALRLRPTATGDGRIVAPWRPSEVTQPFVWASLDCPGAHAVNPDGARGISVLGRLTARVMEAPAPGDECVVVGWPLGGDGRRFHAGTALFRDDRPLAVARAVWFMVGDEARDGTLTRVNGR